MDADQQALIGSTVQLKCPYTATSSNNLVWNYFSGSSVVYFAENKFINTITLSPSIYRRLSVSGNHNIGEYHLTIADVRKSDEGRYECSVSINIVIITLAIIGKQSLSVEAPKTTSCVMKDDLLL